MYEEMTYENIKQSILDSINTNINKQEGSIINDMVSPVSLEISNAYIEFKKILDIMFLDSTDGDYIDRKVKDYGIYRKDGTKSTCIVTFTGIENTLIPLGTLVQTTGGLLFQTTEEKTIIGTTIDIKVEATGIGNLYNVVENTIVNIPVSVTGVLSVNNNVKSSGGTEIETDENLINRYLQQLQNPSTSGNAEHYRLWTNSIDGVGNSKVIPLWNGAGTVKVLVVDSNKIPANETIINEVYNYIEIVRPIGATVTVAAPGTIEINVSATLSLGTNISLETVLILFKTVLNEYIKNLVFSNKQISYAVIGSLLLGIEGILDYTNLTVNGGTSNISIGETEVPIMGTVSLN